MSRWTSYIACCITCFSSLSLVAATVYPQTTTPLRVSSSVLWNEEDELLSDAVEGSNADSTLLGLDGPLDSPATEQDAALPFEESNPNIEDQNRSMVQPSDMQPDLQKVLYDPKMDYGTGSPVPKPTPITTAKRNLIVLGTSAILATVAMLVVSTNKGLDASHRQ
jgi:hypothetical protein